MHRLCLYAVARISAALFKCTLVISLEFSSFVNVWHSLKNENYGCFSNIIWPKNYTTVYSKIYSFTVICPKENRREKKTEISKFKKRFRNFFVYKLKYVFGFTFLLPMFKSGCGTPDKVCALNFTIDKQKSFIK